MPKIMTLSLKVHSRVTTQVKLHQGSQKFLLTMTKTKVYLVSGPIFALQKNLLNIKIC